MLLAACAAAAQQRIAEKKGKEGERKGENMHFFPSPLCNAVLLAAQEEGRRELLVLIIRGLPRASKQLQNKLLPCQGCWSPPCLIPAVWGAKPSAASPHPEKRGVRTERWRGDRKAALLPGATR